MKELWVGKEVEGKHKGLQTLFIGADTITYKEIMDAVDKYNVKQLYFGAGRCTNINKNVLRKCLTSAKLLITAEINLTFIDTYKEFYNTDVNIILTINHKNFTKDLCYNENTQFKIQNLNKDVLILLNGGDVVDVSTLNGKTYEGDILLKGKPRHKRIKRGDIRW